jgi:hypothetical protein
MATQHPEHYIVIVSWSGRESRFLNSLSKLVEQRIAAAGQYRCLLWDWGIDADRRPSWKQRLFAPIDLRVRRLRGYLRREPFYKDDEHSDPEITLIAHGRSCSVVKAYLLDLVDPAGENHDDWRGRRRVRQAIFVAPLRARRIRAVLWTGIGMLVAAAALYVWGKLHSDASPLFDPLAYVIGGVGTLIFALLPLLADEQMRSLLGLPKNLDTDRIDLRFEELIVNGSKSLAGTWPIPSQVLKLDSLVPSVDVADSIGDAVVTPQGHKNVYEVARQTVQFEAAPIDPREAPPDVQRRGSFDNRTLRTLTVWFSERNNTEDTNLPPFDLPYRTQGCLEINPEPTPNLWTGPEQGDWLANRKQFHYRFRPATGNNYALKATVYGGFNQGDRSAHSHIRVDCYIRELQYTLDLRQYLSAHWTISRPPEVYYIPPRPPTVFNKDRSFPDEDCECLIIGRKLETGRRLEVTTLEPGLFQWTIYSIRNGGTMGFLFDVSAPAGLKDQKPGASAAGASGLAAQ